MNFIKLWNYVKYPRTYHLPFSLGKTEDDKTLIDCNHFLNREVIATVKMDGENTTAYSDGHIHARSLDSSNHETRDWVKSFLKPKLFDLPKNWRICGENLYAKHSIFYDNLKSFFYLFSIWNEENKCLSWDETMEWAELLQIQPVISLYRGIWNENAIRNAYSEYALSNESEGFVVRLADSFAYEEFDKSVAKFVRKNHVQTNQHWMYSQIVKNEIGT